MTKRDLTPKQQRFVEEYLIDLNGTQAAIRAGYAVSGAAVEASRLLTNANISEAIQKQRDKLSDEATKSGRWVLERLVKEAEAIENSDTARISALDKLGRHHGIYETDNAQKGLGGLAEWIDERSS